MSKMIHMKKSIDQSPPRRFAHMNKVDNKAERSRQREIDIQNKKLLNSIMHIMKRRNTSVQHARRMPDNIIGGTQSSVHSKFGDTLFRNSNSVL